MFRHHSDNAKGILKKFSWFPMISAGLLLVFVAGCNRQQAQRTTNQTTTLTGIARVVSGDSVFFTQKVNEDGIYEVTDADIPPGFYTIELFEKEERQKNEFLIFFDELPLRIRFNTVNPARYPQIFTHRKYQADIQKYYSKLNPLLQVAERDYEKTKLAVSFEMQRSADREDISKLKQQLNTAERRKQGVVNDVRVNYILNNPSSLLSAYLITQSEDELSENAVLYEDLYKNLTDEVKASKYGIEAESMIKSAREKVTHL